MGSTPTLSANYIKRGETISDFRLELAQSYDQNDIDFARRQRKFFANLVQDSSIDKKSRKSHQQFIKATTCVIDHIEGKFEKKQIFPTELQSKIRTVFCFIGDEPRTEFNSIYS